MHELGLINYVVKQVTKLAEENKVEKIASITLEFGEVSGIVTSYLHDYWKWYQKKFPLVDEAELKTNEIPAITWCDDCKIRYSTVQYGKKCPHCSSENTWLIQGDEMRIKNITVVDPDGPTPKAVLAVMQGNPDDCKDEKEE